MLEARYQSCRGCGLCRPALRYAILARIARAKGALVIEDACHGPGGGFHFEGKNWKLGGHPWADMTVFSFHPVKTITTGEGGILVTDNDEYARRARLLRSHGMERDHGRFHAFGQLGHPLSEAGPWAYEMQELGYNYRITDLQCALGRSQLKKLSAFIRRRQEIVASYNEAFANIPWLKTPAVSEAGVQKAESKSQVSGFSFQLSDLSLHLYTVQIDFPSLGRTRSDVMTTLRQQGIGSQVLYIPVYLQPWYRQTYGYTPGKCPKAESFYAQALSLPFYPALSDEEVQRVIQVVHSLA